jgi:hypothetical protein
LQFEDHACLDILELFSLENNTIRLMLRTKTQSLKRNLKLKAKTKAENEILKPNIYVQSGPSYARLSIVQRTLSSWRCFHLASDRCKLFPVSWIVNDSRVVPIIVGATISRPRLHTYAFTRDLTRSSTISRVLPQ